MKLKFCPTTIFREAPKVTFFDAGIESTNGCDVVIHSGEAISPPDEFEYEQYSCTIIKSCYEGDNCTIIDGEKNLISGLFCFSYLKFIFFS